MVCPTSARGRFRIRLLALAMLASLFNSSSPAQQVTLEPQIVTTTGLTSPVFATAPLGNSTDLYVSEQNAVRIQRLDLESKTFTTVLDLPDISGSQAGLQAIALHPDYPENGRVYLNLYDPSDRHVKVMEFTRSAADPTVFDPDSGRVVFSVLNEQGSHNGGWLGFSPIDEYLYIITGDGGNLGRRTDGQPAQDLDSPLGKLLRLDVNADSFPEDDQRNYAIPEDNPFVDVDGMDEIFAYGLRHAFRAGFDRLTGDLFIGDVGRGLREEINFLPADSGGGQNFGWRAKEGSREGPFGDPIPPDVIDPIYEYARGSGAAVIGGYVYRGSEFPALQGTYFFADFVRDDLFSFRYDGEQVTELTDRGAELAHPAGSYGRIVSFGEGGDGDLYLIDYIRGDILKIVATGLVGDYSGDGLVEQTDLDLVLANWGEAADVPPTGWVHDLPTGNIDQEELDGVLANWGASSNLGLASVPEPASLVLGLLAALAFGSGAQRFRRQVPGQK